MLLLAVPLAAIAKAPYAAPNDFTGGLTGTWVSGSWPQGRDEVLR